MSARVTLIPTVGPLAGRVIAFTSRTFCTVGRSEACLLRVCGNDPDLTVSRRHCLLDIDPPLVRVRDLGSCNGTFVNGRRIGRRASGAPPEEVGAGMEGTELHDGDRLALGASEFVVGIHADPPGG